MSKKQKKKNVNNASAQDYTKGYESDKNARSSKQRQNTSYASTNNEPTIYDVAEFLADFHVHYKDFSDGVYELKDILGICNDNDDDKTVGKVSHVGIVQHDTQNALIEIVNRLKLDPKKIVHNINNVNTMFGTELTVRDSNCLNLKGNPLKEHILFYGQPMDENNLFNRLLQIKAENDRLVDYGLLEYVAKVKGITLDDQTVKNYVLSRRANNSGFNTFTDKDVVDFFEKNNIQVAKSNRELMRILEKAPRVERLNIEMEDAIKLAHYVGAVAIFAHPPANLRRAADYKKAIYNFLKAGGDGFEIITNSMDNNWYGKIMSAIKMYANIVKNPLLFTGGSDTHVAGSDVTIGKTVIGPITEASQRGFINAMKQIERARQQGKTTNRTYYVTREEAEAIVKKYADRAAEIAANYKQQMSESRRQEKNSPVRIKNDKTINPLTYKSLNQYMAAVEASYIDPNDAIEDQVIEIGGEKISPQPVTTDATQEVQVEETAETVEKTTESVEQTQEDVKTEEPQAPVSDDDFTGGE